MLSREDNERLVRVGKGTPLGDLFRLYWIPFLPSADLAKDGQPKRIRLLGEDLVAFRDTEGRVGLVDQACPHRGAPLIFARNEDCGLRCVYHGWKFDVTGTVTDMPAEPVRSRLKERVRIKAYPCKERNGMIWTYMGPDQAELRRCRTSNGIWCRRSRCTSRFASRSAIGCRRWRARSTPRTHHCCTGGWMRRAPRAPGSRSATCGRPSNASSRTSA